MHISRTITYNKYQQQNGTLSAPKNPVVASKQPSSELILKIYIYFIRVSLSMCRYIFLCILIFIVYYTSIIHSIKGCLMGWQRSTGLRAYVIHDESDRQFLRTYFFSSRLSYFIFSRTKLLLDNHHHVI